MELRSILCASLVGKGVAGRMDTYVCMAETLRCSPETSTSFLMDYTPIQNKKFKVTKKKEYWSELSFPFPGHLSNSGIEPTSPAFPELAGRFFTT